MVIRAVLNEADKLLLKNNIKTIPISFENLKAIAESEGWLITSYRQGWELIDTLGLSDYVKFHCAFTLKHNGENIIMYDGKLSYEEKIHCICHEFGHIILEHTEDSYIVGYSQDSEQQSKQEQEAEAFAAEMAAPIFFLRKSAIKTIDDLIKTGLLNKNQAILHMENIKLNFPETDIDIALSNRIFPINNSRNRKIRKLGIITSGIVFFLVIIGFVTLKYISNYNQQVNSEMVYVTVSGKSYHIENCYHIRDKDNLICISSKKAESSGYKPCKDCIGELGTFNIF